MKAITIHVSEPVYQEFKEYARKNDRKAAELIREAMELYREQAIRRSSETSLRRLRPVSVGKIWGPLEAEDDLLGDMIQL